MKTKLFIAGLAVFAISTMGFAQDGNPQDRPGRGQCNQAGWVDENKNGVCDYYENGSSRRGSTESKGIGCQGMNQGRQGQGMMNGRGMGRNFTDENKDGVCDRFEDAQKTQADKK